MCMSIKCCFLFFNAIFSASGVALIIIGVQQYSNYSLLGAFAMASLSKVSIVLIAVGVAITEIKLKTVINNKTEKVINEYNPEKRKAIDELQEKFRCCGAVGPIDWTTSVGWENHEAVPDSCCVVKSPDCGQKKENIRAKGCVKAIDTFMTNNLRWVSAVCICLGVAGVLGVFSRVFLGLTMKQKCYENMN